jgi:hypothetical protein
MGKRCLLLLDKVTSTTQVEEIRLSTTAPTQFLLGSTYSSALAVEMAQEGRIKHTRLPVLSHEKARELLSNRVVDSISSDPDFDELALALVNECKLNPRLICEVADLVKPSGAYAYDLQGCFKYMRATGYIHRYFHPQTASFEKP